MASDGLSHINTGGKDSTRSHSATSSTFACLAEAINDRRAPSDGVLEQRQEKAEVEDLVDELCEPFAEIGTTKCEPDCSRCKFDDCQESKRAKG